MRISIEGGTIVNEGRAFVGNVLIDHEQIVAVQPESLPLKADQVVDARGCLVLPGIIDEHVHFREPGLTDKADMVSESRAAAAGGVTTFFDMPNTIPQTTTLEALHDKYCRAEGRSMVNYAFFFGATIDNTSLFDRLDPHMLPGIKLFMGSSTGNMLVDDAEALECIFKTTPIPLMTHCEDTAIINRNMAALKERYGDDPDVRFHPLVRSEEACLSSTMKAIELAAKYGTRLHLAHISTKAELDCISAASLHTISAEATVGHLLFSCADYTTLGTRIKVNPAIKSLADREALRQGLSDKRISTVATDHAPHLLPQKQGGCVRAASGMPMVQFSLPAMLQLVDEGVLTIERLVELMSHNPAAIFGVRNRGFLRPGYQADVVIVRPDAPWTLATDVIESKCRWSPLEGRQFRWKVEQTFCNGHLIYHHGVVGNDPAGKPVKFR